MKKIVVLEGNIVERKGVLDKIKNSLVDYEYLSFDSNDSYDNVSHTITEISCFGERRLFVIKGLPKVEAPDESQARTKVMGYFKKIFPSIPNGNVVVFDNVGISAESFLKEVRKFGKVYKFDQKINKRDAKRIVNDYFKKKNIQFDDESVVMVVDSLNLEGHDVDVDKLHLLIQQVYNYVCNKSKIKKDDVYKVCSTSKEFIIWNLYSLLDDKDVCSSLAVVAKHLDNAKYFRNEAEFLMKGMLWRYGLLLLAKCGFNHDMSQKEVKDKISNINKLESKGKAQKIVLSVKTKDNKPTPEYSDKMINSIMNRNYGRIPVACYTFEQLLLIYYVLSSTELKIRSGCTESEIRTFVHITILVICGKISKKNTVDGILKYSKMEIMDR